MNAKQITYGIPGALLNLGLCLGIPILFPSAGIAWWWVLLWSLGILILLLLLGETAFGRWIMPGLLLAVTGILLVFQQASLRSFGCLANDLQEVWIRSHRKVLLSWDSGTNGILALLLLAVLVQMLLCLATITGYPVLLALIYIPVGLLLAFGYQLSWPSLLCILFSLFLFLGQGGEQSSLCSEKNRETKVFSSGPGGETNAFFLKEGLKKSLARVGMVVFLGSILLGILAASGLMKSKLFNADQLQTYFSDKLHEARYDSASNSMPEGDLLHTGEWEKSDSTALEVTMEKPEKAYIKGHVYNYYTGTGWQQAELSKAGEDSDLFYWLHQNDFYGQIQLSKSLSLVGSPEWSTMTVKNISACKENSYLPYGYADSSQLDDGLIGDENTENGVESFVISSGGLADWYEAQKTLVKKQKAEKLKDYLSQETAYKKYVYEENLELPDSAAEVLERQLGDNEENLTMDEIQKNIYDYLSVCMSYEENADAMEEGDEFLEYLLEETQEGYSVHYATAAVLMLRYYGVPARYVEGYFLSRDQAARMESGEPLTLTEENAHAWAEYYLDGVGFVPFEVTPGYIDEEDIDQADEADGDANNNQYAGKRIKSKDYEKPEVEPKEEDPGAWPLGVWILLGILSLLLLFLLIFLVSRRLKLKRFLEKLDRADVAAAVADNYAYAMLFKEQAHKKELIISDEASHNKAKLLNEEAMFSNHPLSEEDRQFMTSYRKQVLEDCKKTWSFLQKVSYRLLKGLY